MVELTKKLEDAQKELGHKKSQLDESNKNLADYEAKRNDDLDADKQKWYNYYFREQTVVVVKIQGMLYHAGYNMELDTAPIPFASELRTQVLIPVDFNYEEESEQIKGDN